MSKILPQALDILAFWGAHPAQLREPINVIRVFAAFAAILFTFVMMVSYIFTDWEGVTSIEANADGITTVYQVLWKVAVLFYRRDDLVRVLRTIKAFKISHLAPGTDLHVTVERLHDFTGMSFGVLRNIIALAGLMYGFKAVLYWQRILPATYWTGCDLDSTICYLSWYVFQLWATAFTISITIGVEGVFFASVAYAYTELEAIKHGFRNLAAGESDEESSLVEFSELVEHHSVVLKFIGDLDTIYSAAIFHLFASEVMAACFAIFDISIQGFPPSIPLLVQNIPFIMAYHAELFVICACGEMLTQQAFDVRNAVYESDWYVEHRPRLAKAILIVMQKATQKVKLTIGGLWDLELRMFIVVAKTSASVLALVKTFYDFDEL